MKRRDFFKLASQVFAGFTLLPITDNMLSEGDDGRTFKPANTEKHLNISGIYPHLAVFNNGGECGIGAIVVWNDKLWLTTYPPSAPKQSPDKLYSINKNLNITIHPESIGGTNANRMIHRETNQLIIGPYFIDEKENIRALPIEEMNARLTATARHLKQPADKVYFYGMEGKLYEVNVHNLKPTLLFKKPIPGWHGKGGYTAQDRLILANNSQHPHYDDYAHLLQAGSLRNSDEDQGVLAEWDGEHWEIIERRKFTEVTGPGGIYGAPDEEAPAWSLGWDKRSVLLELLDNGQWHTYRLPKANHTYDSRNGWYTEWPRIRSVTDDQWMMDMHGMFYDFPREFKRKQSGAITPISSHLRMVPDFCGWNDQIVLASDDASVISTPYVGQSQSNMWFGSREELSNWGPANGYGGLWMEDTIKAGKPSQPYLINGFDQKIAHLTHNQDHPVSFIFEIDKKGNNTWKPYKTITVSANGYEYFIFPYSFDAHWIRVTSDQDCKASIFFHYSTKGHDSADGQKLFQGLANIDSVQNYSAGLIRPAGHNRSLQFLSWHNGNHAADSSYYEIDKNLQFNQPSENRSQEVARICALDKTFKIDEASVIIEDKSGTFRLPKTDNRYDRPFWFGWPRDRRQLVTERYMYNVHGTFYVIPAAGGMQQIQPVTTHRKAIADFCSWRGLMVMSGVNKKAIEDGQVFKSNNNDTGLWFGNVDDLWKLGKPVGEGGPWKNSIVKADEPSLPYLMTGYDRKKIELQANEDATLTVEVNFDHNGWHTYKKIGVTANQPITHEFPKGFSAHWVRLRSNIDVNATAWFTYT